MILRTVCTTNFKLRVFVHAFFQTFCNSGDWAVGHPIAPTYVPTNQAGSGEKTQLIVELNKKYKLFGPDTHFIFLPKGTKQNHGTLIKQRTCDKTKNL